MQMTDAIEEYRYAISQHSQETQIWYLRMLGVFSEWCTAQHLTLEKIKPSDIGRFLEMIRTTHTNPRTHKPVTSHTVSAYARTIKAFLNWCAREEGLEDIVSMRLPARIAMPKIEQKVIEIFTYEHITALLAACEQGESEYLAIRDKAIVSLLLETGIRVSELCNLILDDVHLDPRDPHIKVLGKGRKEREIGLGKKACSILRDYIQHTRQAPASETHLFLSKRGKPCTINCIDQLLKRLAIYGHIDGVRCSAHTFRHTFAVEYLRHGGDVFKLSRLMGHASVQITSDVYLNAFRARDARQGGISIVDAMHLK